MRSLLTGVAPDRIRTEPFPHLVVPDALEAEAYAALCAGFPPLPAIVGTGVTRFASNRRYAVLADQLLAAPDTPECWRRFARIHTEPAFLAEVAALFAGHWPPALLAALGGRLTGHATERFRLDAGGTARIRMDARLEVNTPILDVASSARGPHLDAPNRLYSGLFYLRHPQDDAIGGDLELFRWRDGPVRGIHAHVLPPEAVERVASVPYRANTLVLFPQGIDAIHGVGLRQPTPHVRRYVFITAELADPWLHAPGHAGAVP